MLKPCHSPQFKKNSAGSDGECCLCGRLTLGLDGAMHVPVDHTCMEFVTARQATERGDDVSYFPIGPECVKKWRKEFDAEAVRFRRTKAGVTADDRRVS